MNLDNLDKNKRYLLACSYGPDSMALFYLLVQGGYRLSVAHVNYGLRKEAAQETIDLKNYCDKNGIELFVKYASPDPKGNIEKECREIRYKFFHDIVKEKKLDEVLVAHNQDDVLETYIMQKRRHNCPEFFGIKEKIRIFNVNIERPLLNYSKAQLLELCKENNVPFSIDSTNLEDKYLRNQIRHQIVEKLSDEERRQLIEEIGDRNEEIAHIKERLGRLKLNDVSTLLSLDELTYLYALNRLANSHNISKKQALEIRKVLVSEKPNVYCRINKKLMFVKEYEECCFKYAIKTEVSYSTILDKRCALDDEHFFINLESDTTNLNISDDSFPITIRTARPDDEVTINGYVVEARRLFIDWKMPLSVRKQWPVILDKNQKVIYIPRYQKDFKNDGKRNFYVKLK